MANLSPKEKFEKERSLKSDLAKAEANVQHQTAWIERQDAKVNPDGSIDWTVSHRRVLYDRDPALQQLTQLHFNGAGKIYTDAACTKPFDTTNMVTHISGPGKGIYVMTDKGSLHASSHSVGHRHHSSLLAGIETAGAGELEVKAGVLKWISNKSGHYCPNLKHFLQVLHVLERKGKISNSFKIMYFPTKQEFANTAAFQGQMIAADEDWDYEFNKLMLYHQHLTDVILATHTPNAWRWRNPDEAPGVYDVVTNTLVPHRDVRSWLKGKGHGMRPDVQKGTGR
jgi:hypothetical protein